MKTLRSVLDRPSVSALSILLIVKLIGLLLGMVLRSLPVDVVKSLGLKELVHLNDARKNMVQALH